MLDAYQRSLEKLEIKGWTVRVLGRAQSLPENIATRYRWVPGDVQQFVTELEMAVSPDQKAWLLGMPDFLGSSASSFRWDEWQQQSLEAADGDSKWLARIRAFWDCHFTVGMSVKTGYAYFAVRKQDLCVVCGEEPEFEETATVADSFLQFLTLLGEAPESLKKWA